MSLISFDQIHFPSLKFLYIKFIKRHHIPHHIPLLHTLGVNSLYQVQHSYFFSFDMFYPNLILSGLIPCNDPSLLDHINNYFLARPLRTQHPALSTLFNSYKSMMNSLILPVISSSTLLNQFISSLISSILQSLRPFHSQLIAFDVDTLCIITPYPTDICNHLNSHLQSTYNTPHLKLILQL